MSKDDSTIDLFDAINNDVEYIHIDVEPDEDEDRGHKLDYNTIIYVLLTTGYCYDAWAARKLWIKLHGDGQDFKSKMKSAFPVCELWYTPWFKRSEVKKRLQTAGITQIDEVEFCEINKKDKTSFWVNINKKPFLIKDGLPIIRQGG